MTTTADARMVRGACPHDCPDTCALQISVQDGRVTRIVGDAEHPTTHGALCTKVSRYAERSYPERNPCGASAPERGFGDRSAGCCADLVAHG
jgi:anaerobic selenocysteine-containing dehydrogenase